MEIHRIGLSGMFGALVGACRLIGDNPGRFMLASLLGMLAVFATAILFSVLSVWAFGLEGAGDASLTMVAVLYAVISLIFVVLLPPMVAGWFQLCRALSDGRPVSAFTLFAPYGRAGEWKKTVVYSLLGIALYLLVHVLYVLLAVYAFGIEWQELGAFLGAQRGDLAALAGLSRGFWIAYIGIMLVGIVLQSMFMLGFGQVALTDNTAGAAFRAGIAGALKNLFSIVLFLVLCTIAVLLAALVIGVLLGFAVALIGKLNTAVAAAIGIVFYVLVILLLYPLIFSFETLLWRAILGDGRRYGETLTAPEVSA